MRYVTSPHATLGVLQLCTRMGYECLRPSVARPTRIARGGRWETLAVAMDGRQTFCCVNLLAAEQMVPGNLQTPECFTRTP